MNNQLLIGDCRVILPTLEAGSVQMICTSPPYWGLRDYGTAQWAGGSEGCDHLMTPHGRPSSRLRMDGREHIGPYDGEKATLTGTPYRELCRKCGARRIDAQIGLEGTIEEYVETMVQVFREVRRVLSDDGTLWLNLGDNYAGGNKGGTFNPETAKPLNRGTAECTSWQTRQQRTKINTCVGGLKPNKYRLRKDLTDKQIAYVLAELAKARSISCDTQEGRP